MKWDSLCNLLPFLQFKKAEKDQWTSVTLVNLNKLQPTTALKVTLSHGCFFTFFKSYKWCQIVKSIASQGYIVFKWFNHLPSFPVLQKRLSLCLSWYWISNKHYLEVPSEPCQTSKMEHFVKTINDWKPLTIFAKHSI